MLCVSNVNKLILYSVSFVFLLKNGSGSGMSNPDPKPTCLRAK
jgi:hypothetical protein